MIALDPKTLWEEIDEAEERRRIHTKLAAKLVRKFAGNWYRDDWKDQPQPENMIFAYVAAILPQIVYANPTFSVEARRVVSHKPIADYMEMALNAWAKDINLHDELELACLDMLFGPFGVMKCGLEPRGDYHTRPEYGVMGRFTMEALMPYAVRIEPSAFLMDPQARVPAEARFMGHTFERDLDELQQDDRYDPAVVKRLQGGDDADARHRDEDGVPRMKDDRNERKRVTLHEIYLPEHGKILTLAADENGGPMFVRQPTDYVGPEDGPYVLFGAYTIPGSAYPLSPIAAMAEQFVELNAHAAAAAKEAGTHKRFGLVNSANKQLRDAVMKVGTGEVAQVQGLDTKDVVEMELGGTSQFRLDYIGVLRDRLDRVMGMSEATRGRTSGSTATEAAIANDHADTRVDYIKSKFSAGVKAVAGRVGWFMFNDPSVVMDVSYKNPQDGQKIEGVFLGGPQPGQDAEWQDFFLNVDAYSLERVDPALQQQRAMTAFQITMQVAPLVMQFPFVKWHDLLDMIGKALNIPDLSEQVLSQEGLAMLNAGIAGGMVPGQLNGFDPNMPAGGPPNMAQQLQRGLAGEQIGGQNPMMAMKQSWGNAGGQNPGIAAGQQLGYLPGGGGRGGGGGGSGGGGGGPIQRPRQTA